MTCTIIIYNYNSLHFLRACIRQVRKYKHPLIEQRIIISEQGSEYEQVKKEFNQPDITVVKMEALGSGYAIDYIMRNVAIDSEFICTLDVDAFPVHKNWLYVSIKLIMECGFSFVGIHAEIEAAYAHNGNFYCMAQYFRVGKTETFKDLALNGGFTKSTNRAASKLTFAETTWSGWSDDAVPAHCWEDNTYNNSKFTFSVDKYLGVAPKEGRYGRLADDLVFHFAFSYNWTMVGNKEESMGVEYLQWIERMKTQGLTDEMIDEILGKLIPLERPIAREVWENKKISPPSLFLNRKIEQLKND